MELADYLRVLRRRWWLIVLAVVVCLGGAALATATQTPSYRTSTRLLVSGTSSGNAIDEIARRQLANQRAVAYSQIATTGPAIQAAADAAGVRTPPGVSATASGDEPFIVITVTAARAKDAQAVANAFVDVLPKTIVQLDQVPSAEPPSLSPIELAGLPSAPFSPDPIRNLLIGAVLGLLLGGAAALMRETLDVRLRHSSEIEKLTGATLLGVVPKEFDKEPLPARTRPQSRRSEAYRQVRTNLEFTGAGGMPRSIVVTSAGQGDGKSSVATNLAVIASRAGRDVVVVDADLRRPAVARYFGLEPRLGLSDVLTGHAAMVDALELVPDERIAILTSGRQPRTPSELIGSVAMVEVIEELESMFDLVIIDTPPVIPVTDAVLLGVHVDGVVLVTRLGETTRSGLRRSLDAVHKVNANLLGIVANAAVEAEDRAYGYGYGYLSGERNDDAPDLRATTRIKAARRRDRSSAVADDADGIAESDADAASQPASGDGVVHLGHRPKHLANKAADGSDAEREQGSDAEREKAPRYLRSPRS